MGLPDPPANSQPKLDLRPDEPVVYAGHGLARVSSTQDAGGKDGSPPATVELEFANGLSVTLPFERAVACLRPVADEDEVARVRAVLRERDAAVEPSWQVRARTTQTKLAAGETLGLAEIVRDAVALERASSSGALSVRERDLYLKARRLLAAELGASMAADEAQAEAWITSQLELPDSAQGSEDLAPS